MRVATGLLAVLLLGVCSCAGSSDAMQKELDEIRSELVKLRAENGILTDRLDSVETAARRMPAARATPPPEDPDRPSLEVVRLTPEAAASAPAEVGKDRPSPRGPQQVTGAEPPAAPAAAGERPVIRLSGKASTVPRPAVKKESAQRQAMKPNTTFLFAFALAESLVLGLPHHAFAQDFPPEEAPATQGQGVSVIQLPPPPPQQQVIYPGYPAPGTDVNAHLPSSSRGTSDTSQSSDGFDLGSSGSGATTLKGNSEGAYVIEGTNNVPEAHTVRRGDTLWDISTRYYQNPYSWPRVWAQNPQIQNPHYIYPGDQIRLRDSDSAGGAGRPGGGVYGIGAGAGRGGFQSGRRIPPQTIFLRDIGWVDDKTDDFWGELVGSPGENMLLAEGHVIYAKLDDKHEAAVGDLLTIFRPLHIPTGGNGELVSVRGTVKVDRYNEKTHMVRGTIVESIDVIERGAKVGAVTRRFEVVAPITSDQDIQAKIITSLYPYQLFGKEQVLFIDKGEKDGVKPGQRFFAVRRADLWQQQIKGAGRLATNRPRIEDDRPGKSDELPHGYDSSLFPEETYAEIRVLAVRDHTATALVTASSREIERSAILISRKGF